MLTVSKFLIFARVVVINQKIKFSSRSNCCAFCNENRPDGPRVRRFCGQILICRQIPILKNWEESHSRLKLLWFDCLVPVSRSDRQGPRLLWFRCNCFGFHPQLVRWIWIGVSEKGPQLDPKQLDSAQLDSAQLFQNSVGFRGNPPNVVPIGPN